MSNNLKKQYYRARANLRQRIKRLELDNLQYVGELPAVPKKITQASINRLNKLTRKELIAKGQFVDKETGETGEQLTRETVGQRAQEQRIESKRRGQYLADRKSFMLQTGYEPYDLGYTYDWENRTFKQPYELKEQHELVGSYEEAVSTAIDNVSDIISQLNNSVLTTAWETFKGGRTNEEAVQSLQEQGIYERLEEAVQVAYEYKGKNDGNNEGNDYMSSRAVVEAVQLLQEGTPLSAEQFQNIANANYVE